MSCYEKIKEFKNKYPGTIAWRLYQNAKVVEEHLNPDEEIIYAFAGQKNDSFLDFFTTAAVVLTNLDKNSLIKIETVISQFMMEEKKKYGYKRIEEN